MAGKKRGQGRMTRQVSNTLYSVGRLPFLVSFAEALRDKLGWEPRYWVTQPELHDGVAAAFPNAILHPFSDANRGVPAPGREAFATSPFDPSLLDRAGDLEYAALQVIDRHTLAEGLPPAARRAFFYRLLGYCLKVVDEYGLTRIVLNASPHCAIDICFFIAIKLRGGQARILHLTGVSGRQVVLRDPVQTPLGIDQTLTAWTEDASRRQPLSPTAEAEFTALTNKVDPDDPWYVAAQKEKNEKFTHLYAAAEFLLDNKLADFSDIDLTAPLEVPQEALKGQKLGIPGAAKQKVNIFARRTVPKYEAAMPRTFARPGAGFEAPQMTWREYYIYRDWALLAKVKLRRSYESIANHFDMSRLTSESYVYLALHYQPERTTCPEGGRFNDQYLAASILAHALPEGWTLLIKEHPSQFLWQTEGELGRWDGYYAQFLSLPRTSFVPLSLPSQTLMSRAKAVATITGMVGWEACARGYPVIVFGEPWYASCPGVCSVKSPQDAKVAFDKIQTGYRPESESTRNFAAIVEHVGQRCYMNPSHAPLYPDLTEEQNRDALVDLFTGAEAYDASGQVDESGP